MKGIIREERVRFASHTEYANVKSKLLEDSKYAAIGRIITAYDDDACTIFYNTEEIVPRAAGPHRRKVLLLFKNPHPGSIETGLYLSAANSKTFWERFFEVSCNSSLLPLIYGDSWVPDIAGAMVSGDYDSEFVYYFKCLFPFPSRQFNELTSLFSSAPVTYRTEIVERSIADFRAFLRRHGIADVIVFFIDGMRVLAGISAAPSGQIMGGIKRGVEEYVAKKSAAGFWRASDGLKVRTPEGVTFYYNMNTRAKT
ncbi:MAG: hypothetical protein M0P57_09005, partial [Syntrophales bacterium]|nr:hypothetical protein [Syntrophales bacterium]